MIFHKTELKDAYLIELEKRGDDRGHFARVFCENEFAKHGLKTRFVQANMSRSVNKHTLRGMHFQTDGAEEAKLVRCTKGSLMDVIIDIRPESPTYCRHLKVELTEDNGLQLYIPEGFAHGFITLEKETEIAYLVSNFYAPGKEGGIRWDDPLFGIEWPTDNPTLSAKDAVYSDYQKIAKD